MDFKEILKELKNSLVVLFTDKYGEFKAESKKDVEAFLEDSKDKLKRWSELLKSGDIDLDDFEWLVKSQKDLLTMKALNKAGVSKISLGHFKNKVVKTVVDVVVGIIL
jgi:hypothetical protein